jgi:hypothetical protein
MAVTQYLQMTVAIIGESRDHVQLRFESSEVQGLKGQGKDSQRYIKTPFSNIQVKTNIILTLIPLYLQPKLYLQSPYDRCSPARSNKTRTSNSVRPVVDTSSSHSMKNIPPVQNYSPRRFVVSSHHQCSTTRFRYPCMCCCMTYCS